MSSASVFSSDVSLSIVVPYGEGALGALAHNSYAIGNQAGADSPVLLTLP